MISFEISVDITYNCHFRCPFCSSARENKKGDMDLNTAKKCLDFIELHNQAKYPTIISITGGEPIFSDNLPNFVNVWAHKRHKVILCTTGGVDVERGYWNKLRSLGLQEVRVSLPAVSEKKCLEIFGEKYNIFAVERNIDLMRKSGLSLCLNFLLSQLSITNFDEVLKFCKKNGLDKIRILGLSKQGRASTNWNQISLTRMEEMKFVKHVDKIANCEDINFEFVGLPNHKWCSHSDNREECLGGITFFHVLTNGDVYPCPSVKSIVEERIGSVFSTQKIVYGERQCKRKAMLEELSGFDFCLDNLKVMI